MRANAISLVLACTVGIGCTSSHPAASEPYSITRTRLDIYYALRQWQPLLTYTDILPSMQFVATSADGTRLSSWQDAALREAVATHLCHRYGVPPRSLAADVLEEIKRRTSIGDNGLAPINHSLVRLLRHHAYTSYIRYKRNRGYTMCSAEHILDMSGYRAVLANVCRMRPAEVAHADLASLFPTVAIAVDNANGGVNDLIAIARGHTAQALSVWSQTSDDESNPGGSLETPAFDAVSWNDHMGVSPSWWRPVRSPRDVLREYGRVIWASVGLIGRHSNGARYPHVWILFYDELTGQWMMEQAFSSHAFGCACMAPW